jgi:hypothetical protein
VFGLGAVSASKLESVRCGLAGGGWFRRGRARWGDVLALVLVVGFQLAMTAFSDVEGLLQRAMFLIAYCWYGAEAVDSVDR